LSGKKVTKNTVAIGKKKEALIQQTKRLFFTLFC